MNFYTVMKETLLVLKGMPLLLTRKRTMEKILESAIEQVERQPAVLSDEHIQELFANSTDSFDFARSVEAAVLNFPRSPESVRNLISSESLEWYDTVTGERDLTRDSFHMYVLGLIDKVSYMTSQEVVPVQTEPLTPDQKHIMWVNATIELPSHERCYTRGIDDAERFHRIVKK